MPRRNANVYKRGMRRLGKGKGRGQAAAPLTPLSTHSQKKPGPGGSQPFPGRRR